MNNRRLFIIIAATFIIFWASLYIFNTGDEPAPQVTAEVNKNEVVVYVSGQVKTPAVITLEDNGDLRFIDAVNAAGGVTDLADTEAVNLAERLGDGQHIHIPTKDIIFREITAQSAAQNSNGLININTADEIKKVRGIGDKTFEKMKDFITV